MVDILTEDLINKAKSGDQYAFCSLIKEWKYQLTSYVFKMINYREDVNDVMQEILIKTWKNLNKFNGDDKFASWLFTIAHNTCIDYLRSHKNNLIDSIDNFDDYAECSLPSDILIKKELVEIINKIVENLPEKQKNVFLLRNDAELSFKEIAEITNEPLNTVLSHMNYALKKIKKELVALYGKEL